MGQDWISPLFLAHETAGFHSFTGGFIGADFGLHEGLPRKLPEEWGETMELWERKRERLENMSTPPDISFAHDYDLCLYMLSPDPEARNWTVIVRCGDGKTYRPAIGRFVPCAGCSEREGEAAWSIEYYQAEKIEILRPGCEPVYIEHPEAQ